MRPEVLAIATNVGIRLFEAGYIALANGVSARWLFNHPHFKKYSRTIRVEVTSNNTDNAPPVKVYIFDVPELINSYNNGDDLLDKYADYDNVVPLSTRATPLTK